MSADPASPPPPLSIHDPARRRRAGYVALALIALVVAFAWRRSAGPRPGLAPDAELGGGDGGVLGVLSRAEDLAERYPEDPRARYLRALRRNAQGDPAGAELDLRAAVARLPSLRGRDPGRRTEVAIRATLAAMWSTQGRQGEAQALVAPVCGAGPDGGVPSTLGLLGLCEGP